MIRVRGLSFRAGDFAVQGVDLDVPAGQYFVLLGPNGSGKTLLIMCLSGLLRARTGAIHIGGREVTRLEPRLRGVGYVPQDYGLFPHLNVARNVTFALVARGTPHREALRRVAPLVETLDLGRLMDHWPRTLSGGERQKVALARALATRPKALLLDEPTSALDGPTRTEVLAQLRRLQADLGVTTLHVCHNLQEARAVAQRAGVMIAGRLVQTGPIEDLVRDPATPDVARLLEVS